MENHDSHRNDVPLGPGELAERVEASAVLAVEPAAARTGGGPRDGGTPGGEPERPSRPVADSVILPSVAPVTDTEAAALDLSPAQQTAIALLTSGRTRADAAVAAGVSRSTLYRWLTDDPRFQAAFNTWQNDVRTTAQAQLLAATHEAVGVVITAIRRGNADLAWKLLQAQNMTIPKTPGPTDARQIELQQRTARKKAEIAARKEQQQIFTDEMLLG